MIDKNFNLNIHEKKIYSQNGEDGIIEYVFSKIGTSNKFSVEFGVGNGFECNTVYLLEKLGWKGLMMDYGSDSNYNWKKIIKKAWSYKNLGIRKNIEKYRNFSKKLKIQNERLENFTFNIKNERVTAENIENLFEKYNVPKNFDLLSIDVDFNDYWIWKSITNYFPRVVVIEYNSSISPEKSLVVPYDSNAKWDGTNFFGASLLALKKLGQEKGYTLLGCDDNGVNAFFCKDEFVSDFNSDINRLYKSPKYGEIINGKHIGHPPSQKIMISI